MSTRPLGMVAAAVLLMAPTTAAADTPVDELPSPSQATLGESVSTLDLSVHEFDRYVYEFDVEDSVTELAQESTAGGDEIITLASDILFDFDKSNLSDTASTRIEDLVKDVPKGAEVDIGGHTDSLGSTKYNKKLSTARAKAVAAVIRKARPDLDLTVEGFGQSDPVDPNTSGGEDDPAARAKNRRVEIRYSS